jgi:hypothetical protein
VTRRSRTAARHACEWRDCGVPAVGYRHIWRVNVLIQHWFCRRHQRRWDAGTRRRYGWSAPREHEAYEG